MKKILLIILCSAAFFSCKKCLMPEKTPPTGAMETTGVLHYDTFPDGWGLYYQTDGHESLILKNTFSSPEAQYENFKQYVNQHTRLSFMDNGETGCFYGIGKVCGYRVVDVVGLK